MVKNSVLNQTSLKTLSKSLINVVNKEEEMPELVKKHVRYMGAASPYSTEKFYLNSYGHQGNYKPISKTSFFAEK